MAVARVALENISKTFRSSRGEVVCALQNLTLEIRDSELLALTGPSGAGKSTLLRIIAGLEQPSGGSVLLNNEPANHLPPASRNVAMVFQHDALFPHLTVRDNLALGLRLRKFSKAEIASRVEEIARTLGIAQHLTRFPKELSGGERQRVALGRALIRQPKVFLLDEPLAHLDTDNREKLRAEIVRLQRELRITTLYVTHDEAESRQIADRIATLKNGRLQGILPRQSKS